jgi:hypothetical protein
VRNSIFIYITRKECSLFLIPNLDAVSKLIPLPAPISKIFNLEFLIKSFGISLSNTLD